MKASVNSEKFKMKIEQYDGNGKVIIHDAKTGKYLFYTYGGNIPFNPKFKSGCTRNIEEILKKAKVDPDSKTSISLDENKFILLPIIYNDAVKTRKSLERQLRAIRDKESDAEKKLTSLISPFKPSWRLSNYFNPRRGRRRNIIITPSEW